MGKSRNKAKKKASVRSSLLANEAQHRQSVEETYTKPIHPGKDGLDEFKDFLSIFYRHIYRHEEELKKLVRQNTVVGRHYDRLVPKRISHEDFFQRYLYRCDKQRVFKWENKRQGRRERERGSSALLDDAAGVQVREALKKADTPTDAPDDDETDVKADAPIVDAADDETDKVQAKGEGQESVEQGGDVVVEDTNPDTQRKEGAAAAASEKKQSEPGASVADHDDDAAKLPALSSLDSTFTTDSDDSCSNSDRDVPTDASLSGKGRAAGGFWRLALFLAGSVNVLLLVAHGVPDDNPLKVSVCSAIGAAGTYDDIILPWWSPKNWRAGVSNRLCPRPIRETVVVTNNGPDEAEEHGTPPRRPWSALANKVRWHRRRTQNYQVSNGGAIIEQLAVDEDDQGLDEDAAPRWSLQRWRSDQQKEIAAREHAQQQDDGTGTSAVSPWSALANKVRGRGWKSKSWGTTDDGDVVYEEQKIYVTTEGHESTTASQGNGLVTSKTPQAYTKTVVTEVKKTTIYTPVR